MTHELITLDQFVNLRKVLPVIDARSEGEFAQGHVLGALNIPLLHNEHRKIVGTVYKQQGSEAAIMKGFELVGPRLAELIQRTNQVAKGKREVVVLCWRGGMRSEIMSWLLSTYGYKVHKLQGGYKAWRNFLLEQMEQQDYSLQVLAGKTGVGKTDLLAMLSEMGEQVLDLERLAHHKGSVFGHLGMESQPSVEQFENCIGEALLDFDGQKRIWVEDESRNIGAVRLPGGLYQKMQESPVVVVEADEGERMTRILKEYGRFPREELVAATAKLEKRLGGLRKKQAIAALLEDDWEEWVRILFAYYDAHYAYHFKKRKNNVQTVISLKGSSPVEQVQRLMENI